mmetsp:Transcript_43444/g.82898  ORF Transcript_43444/g.82898 Transcript_43444/m.82898 type:complete len:220 (+) Transcript_43444:1504-2163(+)
MHDMGTVQREAGGAVQDPQHHHGGVEDVHVGVAGLADAVHREQQHCQMVKGGGQAEPRVAAKHAVRNHHQPEDVHLDEAPHVIRRERDELLLRIPKGHLLIRAAEPLARFIQDAQLGTVEPGGPEDAPHVQQDSHAEEVPVSLVQAQVGYEDVLDEQPRKKARDHRVHEHVGESVAPRAEEDHGARDDHAPGGNGGGFEGGDGGGVLLHSGGVQRHVHL